MQCQVLRTDAKIERRDKGSQSWEHKLKLRNKCDRWAGCKWIVAAATAAAATKSLIKALADGTKHWYWQQQQQLPQPQQQQLPQVRQQVPRILFSSLCSCTCCVTSTLKTRWVNWNSVLFVTFSLALLPRGSLNKPLLRRSVCCARLLLLIATSS